MRPGTNWLMVIIWILFAMLMVERLSSCAVPECKDIDLLRPGISCTYQGTVVYEGSFETEGMGLEGVLSGTWTLQNQDGVQCVVSFGD